MKKRLTSFLVMLTFGVQAQTISNIVLVPSSPDANDTLKFYIYCDFPYMSCDGSAIGSITGFDINAFGHHCMGMLTALCSDVDTIIIPPQPAGNYTFYFTLDAGSGGSPCSPPFVPNDYDTLDFSISPATGLTEYMQEFSLTVFPNPSSGIIMLRINHELNTSHTFFVRNELGELVLTSKLSNNLSLQLNNGIYFISIPSLGLLERIVIIN